MRKRSGLSQEQLARLLSTSRSIVSRCETGEREPNFRFALGCEVIFGIAPREMFGGLYGQIEDAVMAKGAALERGVRNKNDEGSKRIRELLTGMVERASKRGV